MYLNLKKGFPDLVAVFLAGFAVGYAIGAAFASLIWHFNR